MEQLGLFENVKAQLEAQVERIYEANSDYLSQYDQQLADDSAMHYEGWVSQIEGVLSDLDLLEEGLQLNHAVADRMVDALIFSPEYYAIASVENVMYSTSHKGIMATFPIVEEYMQVEAPADQHEELTEKLNAETDWYCTSESDETIGCYFNMEYEAVVYRIIPERLAELFEELLDEYELTGNVA